MSTARQNNIIYSDNSWEETISKYNLYKELDLIIRAENDAPAVKSQLTPQNNSSWIIRSFFVASTLALLGNIPVQSHLLAAKVNTEIQSFIISSAQANETSISASHNHISTTKKVSQTTNNNPKVSSINSAPQELALPIRALETYAGHSSANKNSIWKTYHVKSYDNLTNIFHKIGHQSLLKELKKNKGVIEELKLLKKGSIVRAKSTEGHLTKLIISHNNIDSYVITPNEGSKYKGTWKKNIFEIRQSRSSFTVRNGLFFDGKKSGIANSIIKQLVKVFDWDIDFSHDVRVGDKVTVVFEEIYHDGDKVGTQNLLAAEFINKGREFRTVRYVNKDGKADFFTPQGREMKRAFIRTPIAHARVSSHFNPGRYHPVLHRIKKHEGTDFAARTGTPIMATGNGTVISVGRKGGYGRVVVIRHREGYTTKYAHMSRFKKGIRAGQKVYQGDVIGYVGQSGLATGPHLHYEFRKNGKAVNAMTVSLPNSMSLSTAELQDFRNKAINLVLQLNVLHRFVKANIDIDSSIGG